MKKFDMFAKNQERGDDLRKRMAGRGFIHDPADPEFMVSLGGDGTFLRSERRFPGLPKLCVRDSLVCFRCHDEPIDEMLEMIASGQSRIHDVMKLRASTGEIEFQATNDIAIRNADPRRAIRFRLAVNGKQVGQTLIGDGIVAATPFGSTGYYRSVTGSGFEAGLGIAFNNLTEPRQALHLDADAEVRIEIVRGSAHLTTDNASLLGLFEHGDAIAIGKSDEVARLVGH
jgi:NAD+ kinase